MVMKFHQEVMEIVSYETNMNDELIDGSNTDIVIGVENTDNTT